MDRVFHDNWGLAWTEIWGVKAKPVLPIGGPSQQKRTISKIFLGSIVFCVVALVATEAYA